MGVVITGVAVSSPTTSLLSHGARRLADAAATACLEPTPWTSDDIEMLVNVGVYRERGLGEPALAALIQEDIAANTGNKVAGRHGTFSFDIDNAACGVLTGADVVRGFLESGAIDLGMVVTSDSAPGPMEQLRLPYPEAGGAMLLAHDDSVPGLSAVRLATFPEYWNLVEGYWEWRESSHRRNGGHNRLVVSNRPGFGARAAECAGGVVADLLAGEGVRAQDVDLLIATPEPGFADQLADDLGITHDRTLHLGERLGRFHTAQLIAAVDLARRTQRWAASRTILLVSAGSGITVAAAVYRH
jgi:3-oxoacyl-[acyl-carrier-protein] synthase-3